MTNPTRRTAKFTATIWPSGAVDDYGQETAGTPYTVSCSYLEGGNRTATDSSGITFQPKLMIWYELTDSQPRPDPSKECHIAIGDLTAYSYSEAGAYTVKSNSLQPWVNETQLPDVELAC